MQGYTNSKRENEKKKKRSGKKRRKKKTSVHAHSAASSRDTHQRFNQTQLYADALTGAVLAGVLEGALVAELEFVVTLLKPAATTLAISSFLCGSKDKAYATSFH